MQYVQVIIFSNSKLKTLKKKKLDRKQGFCLQKKK